MKEIILIDPKHLGHNKGSAIGANDTTCATVGAGITNAGDIMNTSGSVEILVLCLEKTNCFKKPSINDSYLKTGFLKALK
jgi:sugar (pentulose or hexulose) kinase